VLIVGVFVVVLVKPEALGDPSELRPMTVSLQFPIEPIDVQLDTEKCWLVIRDKRGQLGDRVPPNLTFGRGGWVCRLVSVRPTDSVRLELKEVNGRSWRVNPFAPYETTVTAVAVRNGEASD
jgi:hypothetical protein